MGIILLEPLFFLISIPIVLETFFKGIFSYFFGLEDSTKQMVYFTLYLY